MVARKLEQIKKLIEYFKSKVQKKETEEEKEEEIGNYSMNEGQTDKVFGFRREVVKGVVIFFGSVLVLAFIFASSDAEEKTKETEELPVVSEAEIASPKKAKNELPNDYETLIAMNQAKEQELRRQTEENAQKAEQMKKEQEAAARAAAEVHEIQAQQPLPAIPNNQTQVMPVAFEQMPQLPEETISKAETARIEKEKEEKYKSPIIFSISEKQNEERREETSESQKRTTVQVKPEYVAPSNSTLGAGTVIPVRLLTGINTDVAGQVMVQVLSDVYDTATGTKLLIPQGSRLTGSYEKKEVTNGRVPVKFEQLTLPNGGYWTIGENIVAIDGAGYTGIAGKVHHHTGQKVSAGAIGSAVAALGSLAAGNVSSQNTYSAGQIATQGAMANLINTTSNLMNQATDIENTVTVEPGYEFNVYVTKNITF